MGDGMAAGATMTRPTTTRTDIDRIQEAKRYSAAANYVSALPARRPAGTQIVPRYEVAHHIDAPLSATQHVEMRTSAVDRSKGFLLASVPLYAAFALGVVLVAVLFAGVPFWSFWAFATFWLSFVLAWVWGYRETLMRSAEGVAFYESQRKWDVIAEEQRRRWEHYEQLVRGDE